MQPPPPSSPVALSAVFPACASAIETLAACHRLHAVGSPTASACARYNTLLGWCIARSLCPRQTGALHACCGGVPHLVGCNRMCKRESSALDDCMMGKGR